MLIESGVQNVYDNLNELMNTLWKIMWLNTSLVCSFFLLSSYNVQCTHHFILNKLFQISVIKRNQHTSYFQMTWWIFNDDHIKKKLTALLHDFSSVFPHTLSPWWYTLELIERKWFYHSNAMVSMRGGGGGGNEIILKMKFDASVLWLWKFNLTM